MTQTTCLLDRLSHFLCFWWYLQLFPPRTNQPGTDDPAERHHASPTVQQEFIAQSGTGELYQHARPLLGSRLNPTAEYPHPCWGAGYLGGLRSSHRQCPPTPTHSEGSPNPLLGESPGSERVAGGIICLGCRQT